ncbi:type II toxin-antitoxin system PemK/MazF family toxin [Rhodococcus sp. X156]|uniref:type II toxin-antitoxin system PemK/MazF family toxin n=1 Tax=Rhodococcus sp. X156 TaxID=2499145 RepID=UPI000FDB697C|nr:type II toxin-antitoxin system PemK/MazF family toxin [Rhodococcus sp. X156]
MQVLLSCLAGGVLVHAWWWGTPPVWLLALALAGTLGQLVVAVVAACRWVLSHTMDLWWARVMGLVLGIWICAAVAVAVLAAELVDAWWAVLVGGVLAGLLLTAWLQLTAPVQLSDVARGDIWWAQVPLEEEGRSPHRPVLVVEVKPRTVDVRMFTSQDKSGHPSYVQTPRLVFSPEPAHSYLRTDRMIELGPADLRKKVGRAPRSLRRAAR